MVINNDDDYDDDGVGGTASSVIGNSLRPNLISVLHDTVTT